MNTWILIILFLRFDLGLTPIHSSSISFKTERGCMEAKKIIEENIKHSYPALDFKSSKVPEDRMFIYCLEDYSAGVQK